MNILKEIDEKLAKLNHLRPFEGRYLMQISQFFKIETTYTSNAIEGNTHTLEETKVILEDGITIGGHTLKEFHEVEGHGKAYDFILTLIKKRQITEGDILHCHKIFSQNIPDFITPGKYRNIEVFISGSKKVLPKADQIPDLMSELINWLNTNRNDYHPIMFAAEVHRRFVNIHPFTDGNGRISRLLMNTCLFQDKYFPVSIPPIYRAEYYQILENNDPNTFGNFIAKIELETIKDIMRFLHVSNA